jgi:RHS repeat-associated protein
VTDTYAYPTNAAGGRNPKLQAVTPAVGTYRLYRHDEAGNTIQLLDYDRDLQLDQIPDGSGQLAFLRTARPEDKLVAFTYDGRGYLRQAADAYGGCFAQRTLATYSSEGLLHRREHRLVDGPGSTVPADSDTILYFVGRPVALLRLDGGGSSLTYLSTDHLGTPVVATTDSGDLIWRGGFEPFGRDYSEAQEAGVFLRFPGQWEDSAWVNEELESGLYYNLHRWYWPGLGRYTQPDPIRLLETHYLYAAARPVLVTDPEGLQPTESNTLPSGAVFCSALGPVDLCSCDTPRLGEAIAHVARREAVYCANKDKPRLQFDAQDLKGAPFPLPWFKPQGNPCVDRCICAHEEFHWWQVLSEIRSGWSDNALECEAYGLQRRCLAEAKRKSQPWSGPWIGRLPIF